MMNETGSRLPSISESKPLAKQQMDEIIVPVAPLPILMPNLPNQVLFSGPREDYFKIAVPLYEASIKCDWIAAKAILEYRPELVRYSIAENGETALHIAAAATRNKHVEMFVRNLVDVMRMEDLELQNENFNTAFYLAAVAGNIKAARIMLEKNRALMIIPGVGGMMPLYAAALFGRHEMVKYLYEFSQHLCDDGWNPQTRGWLLEKCVAGDMLDVVLKIAKRYPELGSGIILGALARNPDAFSKTKSNIIKRSIHLVFTLVGLTVEASENGNEALQLLNIILEDIVKKSKNEIDRILRGPPDSIEQWEKVHSEKVFEALQLQKLVNEHIYTLDVETKNIIRGPPNVIQQNIESVTGELGQAAQLEKLISEYLVNMHLATQNLIKKDNNVVSTKIDQALQLQNSISKHIVSMHVETQDIIQTSIEYNKAKKLQNLINRNIKNMRSNARLGQTYSSRVLFIAAEMGNTVFLLELIRRYPNVISKVNDYGQSIFHIAVKNRYEGIYNLLYEIGSMKDLVTPLKDANENNMLHFVGMMSTEKGLADVSGAALKMQRELLWFQEVRKMIPPSYRERKNNDGLTPKELFTKEHKELIREGEKWMKETASQCMVVAALIATIVFAAAFTIPGGYNQNDGIPIFYRKRLFVAFVVADAMSLFLSSTSILTFLSILTSRYVDRDFVESLPKKLLLGISTLFLSITTMMITFCVSFFILYQKQMQWIPILISGVALMPVILYVVLQYHVLADVIRSTYISRYLFKPRKQFLYYVNPKV